MREDAALTLAVGLALGQLGCGATINGTVREITVRSSTPGAEVYINGGLAGPAPATFKTGNAAEQRITVHAKGYQDKDIVLEPKTKPVPIVLDVLWCLTIVGIAAPLSDAGLGTFVALEPKESDVTLEPASGGGATAIREIRYSPGDIRIRTPPRPPAPPSAPPAEPPPPPKAKPGAKRKL